MDIFYSFYNNVQLTTQGHVSGLLNRYTDGDKLELVYSGYLCRDIEPLEYLFDLFNDPTKRPANYKGPSMSVGDVVMLYYVDDNSVRKFAV